MYDKYIIPGSLEHARHQLRFQDKRCKKSDAEVGHAYAKFRESLYRSQQTRSDTQNKMKKDDL
jgi:hypothetical protein